MANQNSKKMEKVFVLRRKNLVGCTPDNLESFLPIFFVVKFTFFPFVAIKLGHFIVTALFTYLTK
jgi:hypothetical protein